MADRTDNSCALFDYPAQGTSNVPGSVCRRYDYCQVSCGTLKTMLVGAKLSAGDLYNSLKKIDGLVLHVTVKIDKQGDAGVGGGGGGGGKHDKDSEHAASGGSVGAGKSTIVGEMGAELFIPPTGGTIIPNFMLRQLFMRGDTGLPNQVCTSTGLK